MTNNKKQNERRKIYEQAVLLFEKQFPHLKENRGRVSSDEPDYQYRCEFFDRDSWRNAHKKEEI